MRTTKAFFATAFIFTIMVGANAQIPGQFHPFVSPVASEKAKEVMQPNEFERNDGVRTSVTYCNPLSLNGAALDYNNFTIDIKGALTVVQGDPGSSVAVQIPFQVYLRRDGKIIEDPRMEFFQKELYQIEISKVLAFGRPGDQLIINPANKDDWMAKRILKLIR